jgi:hypothetical protein
MRVSRSFSGSSSTYLEEVVVLPEVEDLQYRGPSESAQRRPQRLDWGKLS